MTDKPADSTDDVKRKFAEALERKQQKSRDGVSHEQGQSKSSAAGKGVQKRMFRRKTG